MTVDDTTRQLNDLFREMFADVSSARDGAAPQQLWRCPDGWLVGYSTGRVKGGPHDGGFVAMAYKPIGKGARSRKAAQHERVYIRKFATRKSAKARAEKLYQQHR